jgi:hypothetical protein
MTIVVHPSALSDPAQTLGAVREKVQDQEQYDDVPE